MVQINSDANSSVLTYTTPKSAAPTNESSKAQLFTVSTNSDGTKISSESQYLFEMAVYLQGLDKDGQDKAVEFLSTSDNPLHAVALDHFNQNKASGLTEEVMRSISEQSAALIATTFKGVPRDPSLGPEIGVIPMGVPVFMLEGKTNYYPNQMGTDNSQLRATLDKLEANSPSILNIQQRVDIFGTVRNALLTSENVLQSFDDTLNLNYTLEKARVTINQTEAPEELKANLNDILDQSVKYQDGKQTRYVAGIQQYANDSRVGAEVRENIRKATASQAYNKDLQAILKATNLSVLDAGSVITKLLSKHTDLIRFTPNKINEAIAFYKRDFEKYQDFVKNGFVPPEEKRIEFDLVPLVEGHNYALKVIDEIQNYVSKNMSAITNE